MNAPVRKVAPYVFYGQTTSMCGDCMALVPAKIIIEDDCVYYLKRCREHGVQKALVSTDAHYYKLCHDYLKPGDRPLSPQTRTESASGASVPSTPASTPSLRTRSSHGATSSLTAPWRSSRSSSS